MRKRVELAAPACEGSEQVANRCAGARCDLVGLDHVRGGIEERYLLRPGAIVEKADGGVADAAPRDVDDALESEIVGRLSGDPEISERIADFLAFVEAWSADDAIVEAKRDEAILEGSHLEGGANQDRDLVERVPFALELLDLLADGARLFLGIPRRGDRHPRRIGVGEVGEKGLAETAFIVGDEVRCRAEDVSGRAIVAFESDHGGAGKILLEAENVVDLGAAPAIDRLVVVADAADVPPALGEEPQPEILRDIGVLVLVDQHVAEALLIVGEHVGMLAEDPERFEKKVAEIGGVENLQTLLIGLIELPPASIGEGACVGLRHVLRRQPAVLPGVDPSGELSRRPALLVDPFGLDDLLHQADLVVGVEDREIGLQSDQFGMAPEELRADRVEGAEPLHALDDTADEVADAVLHLPRGLVGEGDGEDFPRLGAVGGEQMGDPGG